MVLERAACLALLEQRDVADAACLYSAAQSLRATDAPGLPTSPRYVSAELQTRLRDLYEEPEYAVARARGQALSPEQACVFALDGFTQ